MMLFLRLLAAASNILTSAPLRAGLPCAGMKGGQGVTNQPSRLMSGTKEVLAGANPSFPGVRGQRTVGAFWPCTATCPDAQHSQGLGPESK